MARGKATLVDSRSTIISRFTVPLSEDSAEHLRDLSRDFPYCRFEVVSSLPTGKAEMVYDLRITGKQVGERVIEEIRRATGVRSVEVLLRSPTLLVVRLVGTIWPIVDLHREMRLSQRYPFFVENGVITLLVVASEAKTRQIYERLRRLSTQVTINSLHHEYGDEGQGVLTPRQREIFRIALAMGYWDVPRRSTLNDIAQRTGVAKSTISESLAIIEKKLLEEASERLLRASES